MMNSNCRIKLKCLLIVDVWLRDPDQQNILFF